MTTQQLFDLIKHRFQVLNKELDSDSKCLLCENRMTEHDIRCNRNTGIRTVRHDYVMKKVLAKIDHHRPRNQCFVISYSQLRLIVQNLKYGQISQLLILNIIFRQGQQQLKQGILQNTNLIFSSNQI
ncbi:Hypothetical_protein [Hexamita inflata]|uniref:Hypothetical_protein n=1 Tax=Hexamita inflata TaxID=28002 RepID=A0AA86PQC4_9EUKA|nr:Hypothetical protein HINF_LOCUS32060 [Hexamita inflata]